MKQIRVLLLGMAILTWMSCTAPKYVPHYKKIDTCVYGSYVEIYKKEKPKYIKGELISIDTSTMIILSNKTQKCEIVRINEIKRFDLQYGKVNSTGWTIPLFLLGSITHGLYGVISIPINLITTVSTTQAEDDAYRYNKKTITYEQLKMFARFPAGVPENISLSDIKRGAIIQTPQ